MRREFFKRSEQLHQIVFQQENFHLLPEIIEIKQIRKENSWSLK